MTSTELVKPDVVAQAIADVETISQAKDMVDATAAMADLAKRRLTDLSEQNRYAANRLAAERKLGEFLRAVPRGTPGRSREGTESVAIFGPLLKDLKLSTTQADRFQRLATIPDQVFHDHVLEQIAKGLEVNLAGALRLAGVRKRGAQQRRTVDAIGVIEDGNASAEDLTHLAAAALVKLTPWSYEASRHLVGMLAAAGARGVEAEAVIRLVSTAPVLSGALVDVDAVDRWAS